jgi:hypothetical protein
MSGWHARLYFFREGPFRRQSSAYKRNCAPARGKETIVRCSRPDRGRGAIISGVLAASILVIGCLIPRGAAAEEAGTAPTCTGCSGSSSESAKPIGRRTFSGRRNPSTEAALRNEGAWEVTATGSCIMTWKLTINVSNGTISGSETTGSVSREGVMRGSVLILGTRYNFIGHMSGTVGSGTWRSTSTGCPGPWTASRPSATAN